MIKIKTITNELNPSEKVVINALSESIQKELRDLDCPECNEPSIVTLSLNKKKLSSLSVQIDACCNSFKKELSEVLGVGQELVL